MINIIIVIVCGYVLWGSYRLLEAGYGLLLVPLWGAILAWAFFSFL